MMKKSPYKYRFSFVMPVYNVEKYLEEAIESIVRQKMSFKRHVQLILVNDGSVDNSGEICKRYVNRYPNNIIYIHQENAGVSAARNAGLEKAEGKYIGFVDSDDKISDNTLSDVYAFFEDNYKQVDVVSIPMELFEAKSGPHVSNDKFRDGTRLIDLNVNFHYRQTTIGNAFVKSSIATSLRFNEKLGNGEDSLYLTQILAKKWRLGVVSTPTYFYRKRNIQTSAVDVSHNNISRYTTELDEWLLYLAEKLTDKKGELPRYVQHVIFYDLVWRYRIEKKPAILTDSQFVQYKKKLVKLVRLIDDRILCGPPNTSTEHKVHLLSLKHKKNAFELLGVNEKGEVVYDDLIVYKSSEGVRFFLDLITIDSGELTIEGWHTGFKVSGLQFFAKVDDMEVAIKYDESRPYVESYSLGDVIYRRNTFKLTLKINKVPLLLKFGVKVVGGERYFSPIKGGKFAGITDSLPGSYRVLKGKLLIHLADPKTLYIKNASKKEIAKREIRLSRSVLKRGGLRVFLTRMQFMIAKIAFSRLNVWLVSDRSYTAGDNAEYFFRYVVNKKKNKFTFFALDKGNSKYKELRKFSKRVIPFGRWLYKVIFIISDKRISSHFDEYIINAFGPEEVYYRDLITFDYIYLEHGVLASDSSKQFNRYAKNIKLITLAANKEREAILSDDRYGYSKDHLAVTGHPRLDALLDSKRKKKVIIMPTWRLSLAGPNILHNGIPSGRRAYNERFKESEYFKFYSGLMSDRQFIKALKDTGYVAEFYIHPSLSEQWVDFSENDVVKIMKPPHNYEKALREGAVMVTDYSGVAFDFAYQYKPIIYTHFDKARLYETHYYEKGYFDYETHGFGKVTYDYRGALNEVIAAVYNDAKMSDEYRARAENFFTVRDGLSSERIYKKLEEMR